jgi:hypothetical protein
MPWTTPQTWTPGQVVAASDLNSNIRDNALYLFAGRPLGYIQRTGSADYSTSSTSFVDVDAANLILNLTVSSGRVLLLATGTLVNPVNSGIAFDFILDSTTRAGGANGVLLSESNNNAQIFTALGLFTGLAAGAHTFKLQYRALSGTGTIYNNGVPLTLLGLEI